MHRLLISLLAIVAILGMAVPFVAGAVTPPSQTQPYLRSYVPCGTDDVATYKMVQGVPQKVNDTPDGVVDNPCGFTDIIVLAKRLITGWIMAGVVFSTLGFSYAGYLYITAMGSEEKITHAHSIFTKTIWGFVFMLSAWLIAYTIETVFLTPAALENSFLYTPPS